VLRLRISDPVPFWPLDPGSEIRIPNPYFWELSDNFLGKKFYNSLKIDLNFFLQHFKNKIIFNFVKFVATKKATVRQQFFFTPLFCCCFWIRDPGFGIWDPGFGMGKNQDPCSGINIRDPQHCMDYMSEQKQAKRRFCKIWTMGVRVAERLCKDGFSIL
jgi:hypothetical protein